MGWVCTLFVVVRPPFFWLSTYVRSSVLFFVRFYYVGEKDRGLLEGFSSWEGKIDFHGMDPELFHRALALLVKRGRAQVFGSEDQQGVKFF